MKDFRTLFAQLFKPQNKIIYKISCYELGLSNYHKSYIRNSLSLPFRYLLTLGDEE